MIKEDSVLAAHDRVGIKLITRLRIGFSHLNNHKFRQNFKDAINPLCSCGKAIESAIHYYCKTSTIPCRERNSFMFLEPTLKISMTRKSLNSSFFIIFFRSSHPEVFCRKGGPKNFVKFTGKHLCQSFFFNKIAGLRPATLLGKRLWHRYFPVNFAKFRRAPAFKEHLRLLLLFFQIYSALSYFLRFHFFIFFCFALCS